MKPLILLGLLSVLLTNLVRADTDSVATEAELKKLRAKIKRDNPLGYTSTTVFDSVDRPIGSVDPLGNRNTSVYDDAGRQTASVNPLGYRTTSVLDAVGRRVANINPLGQRTTSIFDDAGRTTFIQ